ncbi:hypothetical protein [Ralstonia syzygii]|uniref:Lipoprotein n=2 Tax=Ralstonia syzygii TaxID=28097 RepID=G3AB48_9RALS|nr:hypothetical protein [Ralstonia syzygii]CCA86737.1 exported hypothetical protein [Ralstonia syzygii R24]
MRSRLAWVTSIAASLLGAGCGSFQLGYVKPTQGQNRELMQSDMMFCKDQAKTESESGGNQVTEFLLGFTIIGYPIGRQHNIDNQRASYARCMRDRGYDYTPPTEDASGAPQHVPASPVTVSAKDGSFKITLPPGWMQTVPGPTGDPSIQLTAKNPVADAYLLIGSVSATDIQDWQAYADSLRAKLIHGIAQGTSTEIEKIKVNDFDALRTEITGTLKSGVNVHYLGTVIKSSKTIVYVLAWSVESKFASNRSEFAQLASAIHF